MANVENKLVQEMIEALESLLEGKVTLLREGSFARDDGIDYVFSVDTEHGKWIVPVETRKQAYPRDIMHALWGFKIFYKEYKHATNVVPMFVADLISEGAREFLRENKIGYYELGGTLFIKHKHILIDVQRPRKKNASSGVIDLFSDAREMVVHALLQSHGQWFSGEELSALSGTSSYTVSGVLKELERREWIEKTSEGGRAQRRRLIQPGNLLDSWVDAIKLRKKKKFYGYFFASDPVDCVKKIEQRVRKSNEKLDWALTGALAANHASPLLTGVNVAEIIVPVDKVDMFAESTGIKYAEKGYNVIVNEWAPAGMQFIKDDNEGFPVASDFIQYLSLLDGKGRNAELAEQFRREILEI
ncbi:hypothetical protein ORL97_17455 [Klebsiella michiganensis]|uniref:hypothetical protein n=1 Tax=Enterobacteriaceae TaxID=543 RepID=UPI000BD5B47D|nr:MULTISPECIES: hypothetical protein [Enterobacteriaceae]EIV2084537.1 hypothetical protein [Klebsiella aerogenes]EIW9212778.1 hypothetical protein [Klebsiella aerogenes]MCW9647936.1 hypothetical protein [Klebsiella michiganensis]MCW9659874.1 hypothetical protein [Klebsiella michiganensis]PCM82677.1 hypothetical protein CP903_08825 [Enterobacter cloacae]